MNEENDDFASHFEPKVLSTNMLKEEDDNFGDGDFDSLDLESLKSVMISEKKDPVKRLRK